MTSRQMQRDAALSDLQTLAGQFEREKEKWQAEMRQMQSFVDGERRVCLSH